MDNAQPTTSATGTVDRIWPSWGSLALSGSLGLISLVMLGVTLLSEQWLPALIPLAILAWSVLTFGWVDLELGRLTQVQLLRRSPVAGNQVASLDVEYVRTKSTKWWFPVVTLHDGSEVELRTLRTTAKKKAQDQAAVISHTLGRRTESEPNEDLAAPPPGLVAPQEEFTPLRGLDHIYKPEST